MKESLLPEHEVTPQWLQNNLELVVRVPHTFGNTAADYNSLAFDYVFNANGKRIIVGGSGIDFAVDKFRWTNFFPSGDPAFASQEARVIPERKGYGTLANTLPILCILDIYGKSYLADKYIREDHKPSESRIKLLERIGIDYKSKYDFYEYSTLLLEASKAKGFRINTFEKTELIDEESANFKENWIYKFPHEQVNLLNCQQCYLHDNACRLRNAKNLNDLFEVLNDPEQGDPVNLYTAKSVRDSGWGHPFYGPTNSILHDSYNGLTQAECMDTVNKVVYGEFTHKEP